MARCVALSAFLMVVLFSSSAIATKDFDFFFFVLMWPGAYCRQDRGGCCLPTTEEKPKLDFFIKGLYPYKNNGTGVKKCGGDPFHINEIADLLDGLNDYWPYIKCPSNNGQSNWKNLWKTYGRCSSFTEHEYFKKTLTLRSTIDLLPKLKSRGIVPTDDYDYSSYGVQAAIDDAVGHKTAVRCGQDRSSREYQLYEIWVCVDKDATTIIECPTLPRFSCGSHALFGTFTYDMMVDNPSQQPFNPIEMPVHLSE